MSVDAEVCVAQVRRKADTAKGLVRDWMINWRDNALVSPSESHRQLIGRHPTQFDMMSQGVTCRTPVAL